mmetsp:Transcript_7776/g.22987  ORF Transcript_7776/g.22987 Transcript_7776/m.22987 type:complete len:437 (+) Transcript_7776:2706-4016(+)
MMEGPPPPVPVPDYSSSGRLPGTARRTAHVPSPKRDEPGLPIAPAKSGGKSGSGYQLDLSQDHVMAALVERARRSSSQDAMQTSPAGPPPRGSSTGSGAAGHEVGRQLSLTSDFWKQQQREEELRRTGLQEVVVYSGKYNTQLPEVPDAKHETLETTPQQARQQTQPQSPSQHSPSSRLAAGLAGLAVSGGRSEFPVVPVEATLVKAILVWGGGGASSVEIKGSFDGWETSRRLQQQPDGTWAIAAYLGPGMYQYKFVVDGVWRYDPWAPVMRDEGGNFNNVIEIIDPCTSFDIPSDFDAPPSPTSSYAQDLPTSGDFAAEPPMLPPQAGLTPLDLPMSAAACAWPNAGDPAAVHPAEHAVLNHMWTARTARRSGAAADANRDPLVLGASIRFHAKHIVTLMYKPRAPLEGSSTGHTVVSGRRAAGNDAAFADFNR